MIVELVVFVEQGEELVARELLDVFAKVLVREFNHALSSTQGRPRRAARTVRSAVSDSRYFSDP